MVQISKSEFNKRVMQIIKEIYLDYLINNTYIRNLSQEKVQIAKEWNVRALDFLIYEFSNPNFLKIKMQEEGLKPQIIKARNKKMLRFKKPSSRKSVYRKLPGNIAFEKDGFIFAKMVNHPGFEGRRFIQKMLNDDVLFNILQERVAKQLNEMILSKINV